MRRLGIVVAIAVMLGAVRGLPGTQPFSVAPMASAQAPAIVAGDINCDLAATIDDVTAGLQALTGSAGGGCLELSGDVDCSGAVGLQDMVVLRRHLAGLQVALPSGCPPIGSGRDLGNSTELIEQALASGAITKGQALLYHAQVALGADGLPPQFRGTVTAQDETNVFHEIATYWPTLSQAERDALRPFTLPPSDPGSWAEQSNAGLRSVEWASVSSGSFRVWWQPRRPEDEAKANGILLEMEAVIWPELIGYMGAEHMPPSDAGRPGSGPDGKYDIYLVHNAPDEDLKEPVNGWVSPLLDANGNYPCEATPSYMVINSRRPLGGPLLGTVAHEFMHSIQFTYDVGNCDDYRWLMESTATWAVSYVYPDLDTEHSFGNEYAEKLQVPLEYWAYGDYHQYGSYLFWYYLERVAGLPSAVRDAWAASNYPNSLDAVESATAPLGGLKEAWPESALYNWNRPPYSDFEELDGFLGGAKWKSTDVQITDKAVNYPIPTSIGHMQQDHQQFYIFDGVRSLNFRNPFYGKGEEYAKVQALVSINGTWESTARDWTNEEEVHFCLDKPEEDVDELVIIITNSNHENRSHTFSVGDAVLQASPVGCKGFTGSATAEVYYFDTTFTITVDNLRFEPDPTDEPGGRYDFFDLTSSGNATWQVSGVWPGGCIPSGTMTLGQPGSGPAEIRGYLILDLQEQTYDVHVSGHDLETWMTVTCSNGSFQLPWPVMSVIWDGGPIAHEIDDTTGEMVLDDEYIDPSEVYGGTWRWHFSEGD